MKAALEKLAAQPLQLALGVAVILGVVYFLARKTISDTASAVGGIFSGDNALTAGTVYQGDGVFGTLGAAANSITGGLLEKAGDAIGSTIYAWSSSGAADENLFYTVTFPNGAKHSIGSMSVATDGSFTYQGVRYKIFDDAKGFHFAKAV